MNHNIRKYYYRSLGIAFQYDGGMVGQLSVSAKRCDSSPSVESSSNPSSNSYPDTRPSPTRNPALNHVAPFWGRRPAASLYAKRTITRLQEYGSNCGIRAIVALLVSRSSCAA